MIYLIDNDEPGDQLREIFFVDACYGFDHWFNEQFIPWQKEILAQRGYATSSGYHKVLGCWHSLATGFSKNFKVLRWKQYLEQIHFPGQQREPEPVMPKYVARDWNMRAPLPKLTLSPYLFRLSATDKFAQPSIMVKTSPLHQRKQAAIVFVLAALVEKVVERTENGQVDPADWEVIASTERVWTQGAVALRSQRYPDREDEAMEILREACDLYYNQASQEDKDAGINIRKDPHG